MNNITYITIHGIRKGDWSNHMQEVRRTLLEHDLRALSVNYGYILIPITNRRSVRKALEIIEPQLNEGYDISLVGFSNGCWTAVQIAEMGYPIKELHLISPALHPSHAFPEHVERVNVFYCENDLVGVAGRGWKNITRLNPFRREDHGWGSMMRTGYRGKDCRVTNHRMPDYVRHTFYKHPEVVRDIVGTIIS